MPRKKPAPPKSFAWPTDDEFDVTSAHGHAVRIAALPPSKRDAEIKKLWLAHREFGGDVRKRLGEMIGEYTCIAGGATPSIRLDFAIAEIGYQFDVYLEGEWQATTCRDFGDSYPDSEPLIADLLDRIGDAVKAWRDAH